MHGVIKVKTLLSIVISFTNFDVCLITNRRLAVARMDMSPIDKNERKLLVKMRETAMVADYETASAAATSPVRSQGGWAPPVFRCIFVINISAFAAFL